MKAFRATHSHLMPCDEEDVEETVLIIEVLVKGKLVKAVFVRADGTMGVDTICWFKDCELDWRE